MSLIPRIKVRRNTFTYSRQSRISLTGELLIISTRVGGTSSVSTLQKTRETLWD